MTTRRNRPQDTTAKALSRRTFLAMSGLPVLAVAAPPAGAQAGVVVDPSAVRQTIQGFGGMNHTAWIDDLTPAQRDTAFGNGQGQLGFSVLRLPVHENQSNWSGEVATAQRAVEHGAKVIAAPWNPPSHMVETVNGDQRLRYDMYGEYAQHLNDFNQYMSDNGVDLYGISVQNEPDYAEDWTWWTPQEMARFMRENAGSLATRVIAPESFQYRKNLSDPILNDPEALANLDILGTHLYGTQFGDFDYPLFESRGSGKELWMTEVYYPNSSDSADQWPQALDVGEHIHWALVDGQFQAYVWWYIRRYYGPMLENGQISKRGANMAHFSKFVRPGYVRIDATASPRSNVYTSAYKGGDNEIVIVAVNKGSSVSQSFTMRDTTASSVSSWVTDAGGNLQPQSAISVSDGSFTAVLPAQSVTTFVTGESDDGGDDDDDGGDDDNGGGTGDCRGRVEVVNDWGSGWQGNVTITAGSQAVDGWNVSWDWPGGQQVSSSWNTDLSQSGSTVTASDVGWNGRIEAGQSRQVFGFIASGSAVDLEFDC
ncbi:cellulose binding domain-containing protein [Glycomyces xiaoerkulensis]|uniref:cellulose binding domain-containing protein n=1 Tax=Glycomyces xiaoerkulensis TaxID=2038139 RepID=UPI000C257229|nr:cellulose binding domain-containing protein [Glycomyces xiaoerkulensis]